MKLLKSRKKKRDSVMKTFDLLLLYFLASPRLKTFSISPTGHVALNQFTPQWKISGSNCKCISASYVGVGRQEANCRESFAFSQNKQVFFSPAGFIPRSSPDFGFLLLAGCSSGKLKSSIINYRQESFQDIN